MRLFLLLILSIYFIPVSAQTSMLDTSYNDTGYTIYSTTQTDELYCSAVDTAGRILHCYRPQNALGMSICRFGKNGGLDLTFGNNGTVDIDHATFSPLFNISSLYYQITDVYALPDNKILVIGFADGNTNNHELKKIVFIRLNEDGSYDNTFGTNGTQVVDNIGNYYYSTWAQRTGIQNDGKIVISVRAGVTLVDNPDNVEILTRFKADGTIDTSFNHVGYTNIHFIDPRYILFTSDNSIILPYDWYTDQDTIALFIQKYSSSGALLTTANVFNTYENGMLHMGVCEVVMGPNNEMYASLTGYGVGNNITDYVDSVAVCKITPLLQLDPTWCDNGMQVDSDTNYAQLFHSIKLLPDGSLFRITHTSCNLHNGSIEFIKELPNGQRDVTFGTNGAYYLPAPNNYLYSDIPYGLRTFYLPSQNKLLLASSLTVWDNGTNTSFVTARIKNSPLLNVGIVDNASVSTLINAYPNPIQNGNINLSYELQNKQDVAIDLYDIKGQLISRLMGKQPRSIGKNTESLTLPQNLSAGQYILRIIAGDYQKGIQVVVE